VRLAAAVGLEGEADAYQDERGTTSDCAGADDAPAPGYRLLAGVQRALQDEAR